MTDITNNRDSRIELLRILSAFLILSHHAIQHGGEDTNALMQAPLSVNQMWSSLVGSWGQLGVTIFVILTCWFFLNKRGGYGVKPSKAVDIAVATWIYGVVILLIVLVFKQTVPYGVIIKNLLTPFYPNGYWFITTYIAFYLSLPILGKLLFALSKKQLKYLLFIGSLLIPIYNFIFSGAIGGTLFYFYYIFFVVGFIKQYDDCFIRKHNKVLFVVTTVVIFVLIELCALTSELTGVNALLGMINKIHDSRNILTVIQALSLFFIFLGLKPRKSLVINEIAKTALGTYLITENIVIRGESNQVSILWNGIFHFAEMSKSRLFIPYSIGVIVLVFTCSVIIEYIRMYIVKKIKLKNRLLEKLDQRCLSCFEETQ